MSNTQRDTSQFGFKPSARGISRTDKSVSPSPKKQSSSVDKPERPTRPTLSTTGEGPKLEFNFKIVIRIRPMILKEIRNKEKHCVTVQNDMIRLGSPSYNSKRISITRSCWQTRDITWEFYSVRGNGTLSSIRYSKSKALSTYSTCASNTRSTSPWQA